MLREGLVQTKQTYHVQNRFELLPILDFLPANEQLAFQSFLEASHLQKEDFYYVKNVFPSLVYYRYPYACSFFSFQQSNQHAIKYNPLQIWLMHKDFVDEALDRVHYADYFLAVDGSFVKLLLDDCWDTIPGKQRFPVLRQLHLYSGLSLPLEKWREAVGQRVKSGAEKQMAPPPDEAIPVFRGTNTKSTRLDAAYSWTLSLSNAIRYANRFKDGQGQLYQGFVYGADVIEFLNLRGEQEVLVFPEHVHDLELIPQKNAARELQNLQEANLIKEFAYYRNTYINRYAYDTPKMYGKQHAQRVLMNCLLLGHKLGLNARERALLAHTAMVHDVARQEENHGYAATGYLSHRVGAGHAPVIIDCQQANGKTEYVVKEFNQSEWLVLIWLIDSHDKSRQHAFQQFALLSPNLPDNEMDCFQLYQIFRDADAMDRIRFGDFDRNYLELEEALEALVFVDYLETALHLDEK